MNDVDDDPLASHGCRTLVRSGTSRVGILFGLAPAYDGLDEAKRMRLERVMRLWCDGESLTREMYNGNEGRSTEGTMLHAFKTFKHRLYGFIRQLDGVRTFVIVDYDPAKKRDQSDQNVLKRARGRVDAFGKGKAE
jgi:hypothetical protein